MKLLIYNRRESKTFSLGQVKKKGQENGDQCIELFPEFFFFHQIITAHQWPSAPLVQILLHLTKHYFPKSEEFEARKSLLSLSSLTLYMRNKDILCRLWISVIRENETPVAWPCSFAIRSPAVYCFFKNLFPSFSEMKLVAVKRKSKKNKMSKWQIIEFLAFIFITDSPWEPKEFIY